MIFGKPSVLDAAGFKNLRGDGIFLIHVIPTIIKCSRLLPRVPIQNNQRTIPKTYPMKARGALLCCLLIIPIIMLAQQPALTIGELISIPSKVLKEDRSIAIHLPEGYAASKEKYPVFYVLDGEWNFHYTSALLNTLAEAGDIPKMILVGVINNNRNRDLLPDRAAGQFRTFLESELQPFIEKKYRTQPYRILAGHSFSGLYTLYHLLHHPDDFDAYIALSPSLGRNNEEMVKFAEQVFSNTPTLSQRLYLAVGNEGGWTYTSTKRFTAVLEKYQPEGLQWSFEHLEKEDHSAIGIRGFLGGLEFIYQGFNPTKLALDELGLVEDHYQGLSQQYGYEIPTPEYYYQKFARQQIMEKAFDYAEWILNKYRAKFPNSTELLVTLTDFYLLSGNATAARTILEKRLKLNPEDEAAQGLLRMLGE